MCKNVANHVLKCEVEFFWEVCVEEGAAAMVFAVTLHCHRHSYQIGVLEDIDYGC